MPDDGVVENAEEQREKTKREQQVEEVARKLKIPTHEADRLLSNLEAN